MCIKVKATEKERRIEGGPCSLSLSPLFLSIHILPQLSILEMGLSFLLVYYQTTIAKAARLFFPLSQTLLTRTASLVASFFLCICVCVCVVRYLCANLRYKANMMERESETEYPSLWMTPFTSGLFSQQSTPDSECV